jgi:hypothetical protein
MKSSSRYKQILIAFIIIIPIVLFTVFQPFVKIIKPMWVGIPLDVSCTLILVFSGLALIRKLGIVSPEDMAPGWQIRCAKCGFTEPYGKYGVRIGATNGVRYTVGRCTHCHGFHRFIIEKVN